MDAKKQKSFGTSDPTGGEAEKNHEKYLLDEKAKKFKEELAEKEKL